MIQRTSRGLFFTRSKEDDNYISIESRYDHVDMAFTVCGGSWIGTRISTEASFDEWRCFACPMARSFVITYSASFGTIEGDGGLGVSIFNRELPRFSCSFSGGIFER